MVLNVQELRRRIEEYFKTVTKDQLLKDLVESGLEAYSKSEYKINEFPFVHEKKEQTVVVSVETANNTDVFCEGVGRDKTIVRASYLCGMENIRSANRETNTIVFKTTPTSACSLNWSQYYEYQSRT